MASILPTGFNIGSWSKGLEASVETHKPNIKSNTQSFDRSVGGVAFNKVNTPQYNTHLGARKRNKKMGEFISSVRDQVAQTKEKEQMSAPTAGDDDGGTSLNVAATSVPVRAVGKGRRKPAPKKKKKPAATSGGRVKKKKKTTSSAAIKRLQKARSLQLLPARRRSNKSKKKS